MKILLTVLSKKRPDKIIDKTLSWLKHTTYDWKVFIEPQDVIYYTQTFTQNNINLSRLVVIPKNDMGLGYVMNKIKEYSLKNGYDVFLRLDDDIRAIMDKRLKKEFTLEVLDTIIKNSLPEFEKDPKLGAVRLISNRTYYYVKHINSFWLYKNEFLWGGCYLVRAIAYNLPKDVKTHDDSISSLLMFREGYYILTCNRGIIVDMYSNKGGLQSMDRKDMEFDTLSQLKLLGFVKARIIDKSNLIGYDIDYSAYKPEKVKLFNE